eukprot:3302163-Prorocentrum_lima.AAC.1
MTAFQTSNLNLKEDADRSQKRSNRFQTDMVIPMRLRISTFGSTWRGKVVPGLEGDEERSRCVH